MFRVFSNRPTVRNANLKAEMKAQINFGLGTLGFLLAAAGAMGSISNFGPNRYDALALLGGLFLLHVARKIGLLR